MNLENYFGGAFVLNMDRSPERFDTFVKHLSARGVTGVQRYRAVDGDKCPPPDWWRAGNGAWGCLMSHFRLAQDAIMDGLSSYLVFEDDAILAENFAEVLPRVMDRLEGVEWDQLYLGGQHMYVESGPPWPFRKEIIRGQDITRTHAMAVNARFMVEFAQHIAHAPDYEASYREWVDEAKTKHWHSDHIDHQLGKLHQRRKHLILAVNPWICGQAPGRSNINGQNQKEQWWGDLGWGK